MYRPKNYPTQRHYLPELTYGRPGIRIVLGRLLKGGSTIQETKIGSSVCYEVPCTDEQWQTALWCSGVDPAVVTVEASNITPVPHPYRPYVRIDWHDRQGKLARIVRLVDGATMWSGYTVYIRPDAQVPTRGPRLPEHTDYQPGASACHADWSALSWGTRGAILASLEFLEVPPPAMTLEAERAYSSARRQTLAAALLF